MSKFTTIELSRLPSKHQAKLNPDIEIERWVVSDLELPPLSKIKNRVNVIIFGEIPELND